MDTINRIPACADFSFDGMLFWFAELSKQKLLFHPDDDPADIVSIADGTATFSNEEVEKLREILDGMFTLNGDKVYDAAYPIFMKRMGIQLDA
jgi:hypothetical protein